MKSKFIAVIFIILLLFPMSDNILRAKENTESEETSKEDLDSMNKELDSKNEELEKEKEITDRAKEEMEENEDELEKLQDELMQANNELEVLKKSLDSVTKETSKLLSALQKFSNNNSAVIMYNQLKGSDSLGDFITKLRVMNMLGIEANKIINQLLENLEEVNLKKDEISKKSSHLEEVSKNLQKEIEKYSKDIEVAVNPLEGISSEYFLSECDEGEIYGVDCGTKLKEEKDFQFPISSGSITNEFWGWDALEQSDGHTGIDMIGDEEIHPIAGGEVEEVTVDAYGGIQVMMIHNINGVNYITNYAHLSRVNVVPGDILTTDDVLGIMGETGVATGVHLHLEIIEGPYYIHSKLENPRQYLDFPPLYIEFTKEEEEDE